MIVLLGFSSGLLVGIGYFCSLRWLCNRLIGDTSRRWWLLLTMHCLRIALLTGVAMIAVGYGAATLIALVLGLTIVRIVLISQTQRQASLEQSC